MAAGGRWPPWNLVRSCSKCRVLARSCMRKSSFCVAAKRRVSSSLTLEASPPAGAAPGAAPSAGRGAVQGITGKAGSGLAAACTAWDFRFFFNASVSLFASPLLLRLPCSSSSCSSPSFRRFLFFFTFAPFVGTTAEVGGVVAGGTAAVGGAGPTATVDAWVCNAWCWARRVGLRHAGRVVPAAWRPPGPGADGKFCSSPGCAGGQATGDCSTCTGGRGRGGADFTASFGAFPSFGVAAGTSGGVAARILVTAAAAARAATSAGFWRGGGDDDEVDGEVLRGGVTETGLANIGKDSELDESVDDATFRFVRLGGDPFLLVFLLFT